MSWFRRRQNVPVPQSNELARASANFKRNFSELVTSLSNKGIKPTRNQVNGVFNYAAPGQKSIINRIRSGIVNKLMTIYGNAAAAQTAAAAGALGQRPAAAVVRGANRQLIQIGNGYWRYPNNTSDAVYRENGTLRENVYFNLANRKVKLTALRPRPSQNKDRVTNNSGNIAANITKQPNGKWTINNSQIRMAWKLNNVNRPTKLVRRNGVESV